jgi:NAD-dependent dihydropyrimidine dehydrogenase PreA subunit
MCQFCVQHGDGKAWYLEASTYAYDLDADLKRREYMVEFVRDFEKNRDFALTNLERIEKLPLRVQRLGKAAASKAMIDSHFGQPVPIEECEAILDICTSVVRIPCPCRYAAGTKDEGYCLAITTKPVDEVLDEAYAAYDLGPDTSRFQRLTKEQTLALLRRTEQEGLMHSVWTFVTPFIGAICNCNLESGCMAMTLTVAHDTPNMFKGHGIAEVDLDACVGCAECVERCPFHALTIGPGHKRAVIDEEKCYGCGVCRSACEYDALTLVPREQREAATALEPAGAPA